MTIRSIVPIAAAVTLAACASASVVPLRGTPADVASLTGEWDGTYSSQATGRSGSIWFRLVEGENHAHGDVMMTAAGADAPYRRHSWESEAPSRRSPGNTFLTIRFVRAADGVVDGLLDPYWDASCECLVVTAFRGEALNGKVSGSFISRFADTVATGRWEAKRRGTTLR
jgi:hypothetical protein